MSRQTPSVIPTTSSILAPLDRPLEDEEGVFVLTGVVVMVIGPVGELSVGVGRPTVVHRARSFGKIMKAGLLAPLPAVELGRRLK